jgi:hypothetical protein
MFTAKKVSITTAAHKGAPAPARHATNLFIVVAQRRERCHVGGGIDQDEHVPRSHVAITHGLHTHTHTHTHHIAVCLASPCHASHTHAGCNFMICQKPGEWGEKERTLYSSCSAVSSTSIKTLVPFTVICFLYESSVCVHDQHQHECVSWRVRVCHVSCARDAVPMVGSDSINMFCHHHCAAQSMRC